MIIDSLLSDQWVIKVTFQTGEKIFPLDIKLEDQKIVMQFKGYQNTITFKKEEFLDSQTVGVYSFEAKTFSSPEGHQEEDDVIIALKENHLEIIQRKMHTQIPWIIQQKSSVTPPPLSKRNIRRRRSCCCIL